MSDSGDSGESGWPRREVLKATAAASVSALASGPLAGSAEAQGRGASAAGGNPKLIEFENAKEGARDWQLSRVRLKKRGSVRSTLIEGYCSKQSVAAGESIDVMVSTEPAERFKIDIFRAGYYGGRGARLMTTLGPFDGKTQPLPPENERLLMECRWPPAASLTIPDDWPSGVYLGRLSLVTGDETRGAWQSFVVFIVRDERPADIMFQCSDNTWQAYNKWPVKHSVYSHSKGNQGPWAEVSFDRPYGMYPQIYDNPQSMGSGEFLCWEFPMVYFLEKHGYDVSYCSNSDMLSPERALRCKSFISIGHDEYWDIRQHDSVVKLRDEGVSLLFFSANSCCWVAPLTESIEGQPNRKMFRGGPYGAERDYAQIREKNYGPFPHRGPDEGLLMGARNIHRVIGAGDWTVTRPEHWMFVGTGMNKGDKIPGLVGWEVHGQPATEIPGLQIVAEGTALAGGVTPKEYTATVYEGPKGNVVFNAATIFWAQGVSAPPGHMLPWSHWARPHGPDDRVQRMTHNLIRRALG